LPDSDVLLTLTAPLAQAIHSSGGSPRAEIKSPSLSRLTKAHRSMSCRSEGEREENQRPVLIASRSSMVRIGSSMNCLFGDRVGEICRRRDPPATTLGFVLRCLFVQKRLNPDASVDMVEVFQEMLFFGAHMGKDILAVRSLSQFLDAC